MFVLHMRLEFVSPGEDSVTKVAGHWELEMFLFNMTGHVPPPRPLKAASPAPPTLPTGLGEPLLQLVRYQHIHWTLPRYKIYTFQRTSCLIETVSQTYVISQGNSTGHSDITIGTTDSQIQMFPLYMLHNILSKLLLVIAIQTNPNLPALLVRAVH